MTYLIKTVQLLLFLNPIRLLLPIDGPPTTIHLIMTCTAIPPDGKKDKDERGSTYLRRLTEKLAGVWIEHYSMPLASEHTLGMQMQFKVQPHCRVIIILPIDTRFRRPCRCCAAENNSNFRRPWEWGNNTDFLLPFPPPLHSAVTICMLICSATTNTRKGQAERSSAQLATNGSR